MQLLAVIASLWMVVGGAVSGSAVEAAGELARPGLEIVGEDVFESYGSPNPYRSGALVGEAQLLWSDVIHFPDASYICPHFSRMDLGDGDYVIVRSPDGSRSWRYERFGVDDLGVSGDGFWGIHIAGDTAIVELWSTGTSTGFGYQIDRYARGFTREEARQRTESEAIIGDDDSEWAPCYKVKEPLVYDASRAVARLLINGSGLCTGWLVGDQGHLLTNEHCITTQSQASNTNYEFMAEGATCSTDCWQLQCPGTIVTTSGTLVADSFDYDYALVQLSVNPSGTYGYFTLRPEGGNLIERLFLPQHPLGWGKRVAVYSTHPNDPGYAMVISKSYSGCSGRPGPDMAYRADTQGGSSGSPVVAYSDYRIIALHHCGGSVNTGVLIEQVIAGLGGNLPASAFGMPGQVYYDGFEGGDTSSWSQIAP